MKWLKRITVVITMLCIVSCIMPVSAFALDPEVIEVGETAGALIFDIYGAANNTSLAYDSIQAGPALTEIITLYQNAQAEVGGDPISMTALGTALLAAGAVAVVYDATTEVYNLVLDLNYQNFGEFWYDFNHGWDSILSDVAGLVRDSTSDLFNWPDNNGVVDPIPVYSNTIVSLGNHEIATVPFTLYSDVNDNVKLNVTYNSGHVYAYIAIRPDGNSKTLVIISDMPNSSSCIVTAYNEYSGAIQSTTTTNFSNSTSWGSLRYKNAYSAGVYGIPAYTSSQSTNYWYPDYCIGAAADNPLDTSQTGINISPNPNYVGDPLNDPLEITIPDPASPMPQNVPLHIGTDIEVDPEMLPESVPDNPVPGVAYPITDPAALNDIIPDAWAQTVAGIEVDPDPDFEVDSDPGPDPGGDISEVNLPFLPVTLPSFNFNLYSIWHYVRDWVLSIGSWISLMFQVWSQLPYAIVVPVYATAVIVIVLGLYKRFFM